MDRSLYVISSSYASGTAVGLLHLSPDELKAGATFAAAIVGIALWFGHKTWLKIAGGVLTVISAAIGMYLAINGSIRSREQAVRETEQAAELEETRRAAASASAMIREERYARLRRDLSFDEMDQMGDWLKVPVDTAGTRVEVFSPNSDAESLAFASKIAGMLAANGHWIVTVSCGKLGSVSHMVVELKPELFRFMNIKPHNPEPPLPPEFMEWGAAWILIHAIREVRPDLTISDPQPWSDIKADLPCNHWRTTEPDGGKLHEAKIRLIIGTR